MSKEPQAGVSTLKPRVRWRRIALILIGPLLPLLAAHWIWGRIVEHRLDVLLAEYRLRGEPTTLADLRGPVVPDAENAALNLRAAIRSIDTDERCFILGVHNMEFVLPWTAQENEQAKAAMTRYSSALNQVRQARGKTAFDWQVEWRSPAFHMTLPDLNQQKDLALLVLAAAFWSHQAGHQQDALAYVQDLLFISRALHEYRGHIGQLVSVAISWSAVGAITEMVPTIHVSDQASPSFLSVDQVRQLIGLLLDDEPVRKAHVRGLMDERVETLDLFVTFPGFATRELESKANRAGVAASQYVMKPLLLSDAAISLNYLTLTASKLTEPNWPAFKARVPERPEAVARHPRLHQFFLISAHRQSAHYYWTIAERRMAATALAIRWWSLEHNGRLPASLDDLTPAYLPAIPLDPLSANGSTILYKPDPDRPILYSVGFNGIDDGGLVTNPDGHMWDQPDAVVHLKEQPRREPVLDAGPYIFVPVPAQPESK